MVASRYAEGSLLEDFSHDLFLDRKNASTNWQQEGKTGLIEMPNDDPDALKALLEWCYSNTFTIPKVEVVRDHVLFHLEVYIIAETYGVAALATKAMEEFTKVVGLQKWYCPRKIIPAAAERVYESIPEKQGEAIKRALASASAVHLSGLLQNSEFTDQMADNPLYSRAIGKALRDLPKVYKTFECKIRPRSFFGHLGLWLTTVQGDGCTTSAQASTPQA